MIAFALMLFSASIAAWLIATGTVPAPRRHLRFACILGAALAVAAGLDLALARNVALIVSALVPVLLAVAVAGTRSALASLVLALAALAGMTAAASGFAPLAFAPLLLAALSIAAHALKRETRPAAQLLASSLALVAGAASFVAGDLRGLAALTAFFSAGMMGTALALAPRSEAPVEKARDLGQRPLAIRRPR
jgi:hypothetical protein